MTGSFLLTDVGETIRIAVTPVFLLTGLGALLGVMTGRLARVIDRARALGDKPQIELTAGQREELLLIPGRIRHINRAILLSAIATLAVCVVIALLFVSNLVHLPTAAAVAVTFIGTMLLLMGALVSFIAEIRLALRLHYVAAEPASDN